ncbi:hypothetical protein CRD59_06975 [Bifidobacterium xylocopae]|uniref:Uncharacterized protein n=2 Tax=Bifidobacterium xylocopae TaxID=2493119 RepID=A0A366KBT8_9BIFI|nr:hypothetical protein CRD59_06975 [Bifidobacterium xylocopae]
MLREDNARLRQTMDQQERALQSYQDKTGEEAQLSRKLNLLVRKAADDLSLLLETGVLTVNRFHPRAGLLHKHSDWLRLMQEYSGREQDLIEEQRRLIEKTRTTHRSEYRRAVREGRSGTYLDALKKQQAKEAREVNGQCKQYWAWYELNDLRDNYRQIHHSGIGTDAPELNQYLHILSAASQENSDSEEEAGNGTRCRQDSGRGRSQDRAAGAGTQTAQRAEAAKKQRLQEP